MQVVSLCVCAYPARVNSCLHVQPYTAKKHAELSQDEHQKKTHETQL